MRTRVLALVVGLLQCAGAGASLLPRGTAMVYDDGTGLTWAVSPSAAAMTFSAAQAWVAGLVVDGIGGWRLPDVVDLNTPGCDPGYAQPPYYRSADCGYIGAMDGASELSRLLYGTLGNNVRSSLVNSGPFRVNPSGFAWLGRSHPPTTSTTLTVEGWWIGGSNSFSWGLALNEGFQGPAYVESLGYAWAVRTGDVAAVAEPAPALLMGAGLFTVAWSVRRAGGAQPARRYGRAALTPESRSKTGRTPLWNVLGRQ